MKTHPLPIEPDSRTVRVPVGEVMLDGELILPPDARGLVVFAHGSGSSRHSPRNQYVARIIRASGKGTLLFALLTREEEQEESVTAALRFDIDLLAARLVTVTRWLLEQRATRHLGTGYFGSSAGGATALVAAAGCGRRIDAVVSRGGRSDLAGDALRRVEAPTLLIVGGYDQVVIELNERAYAELRCKKQMQIVPGATHLFEEPGALEAVARLAVDWFHRHLRAHPEAAD